VYNLLMQPLYLSMLPAAQKLFSRYVIERLPFLSFAADKFLFVFDTSDKIRSPSAVMKLTSERSGDGYMAH